MALLMGQTHNPPFTSAVLPSIPISARNVNTALPGGKAPNFYALPAKTDRFRPYRHGMLMSKPGEKRERGYTYENN